MPDIQPLSTSVINKIAAGEVIERPASVVKELVENSLDAGATRVDVAIEQGGVELIRVVDDGCGIAADQLPLAIASHATSKIASADDLFQVATLGFRGEALASIASVSRFSLRSRPPGAEAAALLETVGGEAQAVQPAAGPVGTLIEVRNLFFNTPVRRKFLRTTQTEAGHVSEAITRLALSHPHVGFTLSHNGRSVWDLPPAPLLQRIGQLFGAELSAGLIAVEHADEDIQLSGYVANPVHSRPHNRMQYLLLNGRFIRDRSLQHALGEAYRGLLLTGRYPICFLRLSMSPASVDVNVHPTKLEVRFQDGGRVYSHLLGALRTRFLSTDLVARAQLPDAEPNSAETAAGALPRGGGPSEELVRWAQRELVKEQESLAQDSSAALPAATRDFPDGLSSTAAPPSSGLQLHRVLLEPAGASPEPVVARRDPPHASPPPAALQIHQRYLVLETAEGLEVIDQHALHERILYESLRTRVLSGALEAQRLLTPEPVDVSAAEAAAALEHADLLRQLGLEVSPFGGETILVSSYPAMLRRLRPAEALRTILEPLLAGGKRPEIRDLLDEMLHMMACKAAVKYGDPLTPAEISALLAQRHLAQDHHHCPHGRPTALVFTREQLDRQFKRI